MRKQYTSGITLLELMVVIAVVAILSTIAITSYRGYLMRTNRTEARTALLRVQTAQEKFFLQNNQYADNSELATAPPGGLGVPATTPSGFYAVSITDYTATTYTAVATAQGGQLDDKAACQTLKIKQDGSRDPPDSSGCWK
jgi:type IV pilus assembly protein PilE